MNCGTCKFFAVMAKAENGGHCRRRAPVVMDRAWEHPTYGRQIETSSEWPWIPQSDWCGEFEPTSEIADNIAF